MTTLFTLLDTFNGDENYLPQVEKNYNELFVGTFGGSIVVHYSPFYLTQIRGGLMQVIFSLNLL